METNYVQLNSHQESTLAQQQLLKMWPIWLLMKLPIPKKGNILVSDLKISRQNSNSNTTTHKNRIPIKFNPKQSVSIELNP